MFVQIIQGSAKDAESLRKQFDRWDRDIKPGAQGFLGSTAGVTEDGQFFASARFESEDAARANSNRREQSEWWEETSQYLEGEATFTEYSDVTEYLRGGSDDAGFVQVIQARTDDPDRLREVDRQSDDLMRQHRPDVIGGLRAWHGDGGFTDVVYFTSEAEARAGESKELPAELQQSFEEWQRLMTDVTYFDLKEPRLVSP